MKKLLSAILAGTMAVSMAVPALAKSNGGFNNALDSDGEINDDVYATAAGGGTWTRTPSATEDITIDGVVPNAEFYVALGSSMGDYVIGNDISDLYFYTVEEVKKTETEGGETIVYKIKAETDPFKATHYSNVKGKESEEAKDLKDLSKMEDLTAISLDSLTNKDYFKFDVKKDDGGKYIKKIEVVADKKLGDLGRTAYLKFQLNDSTTTSDLKSNGTLTFKPKGSADSFRSASGSKKLTRKDFWDDNMSDIKLDYTLWINNMKKKNDDNPDSGDRVYFDPDDNEDNTLVWGDDRAALFFEANDDANKFYARLSTKADSEVYSTYGDPLNAELWFFDFVGNATIPATSRATLTLGIPWDDDDSYTPKPEDCYVYEKLDDGSLIDVTSKFTYDEDNDGTTDIEGWSTKVRTLGTYIISDTELDVDILDNDVEEPIDNDTDTTANPEKPIPNTGSSDMVSVAVVTAIVSLAAAGAIGFKKASK